MRTRGDPKSSRGGGGGTVVLQPCSEVLGTTGPGQEVSQGAGTHHLRALCGCTDSCYFWKDGAPRGTPCCQFAADLSSRHLSSGFPSSVTFTKCPPLREPRVQLPTHGHTPASFLSFWLAWGLVGGQGRAGCSARKRHEPRRGLRTSHWAPPLAPTEVKHVRALLARRGAVIVTAALVGGVRGQAAPHAPTCTPARAGREGLSSRPIGANHPPELRAPRSGNELFATKQLKAEPIHFKAELLRKLGF